MHRADQPRTGRRLDPSAVMADFFSRTLESLDYGGVALLMVLENIFPPIPSEVVMPSAGAAAGVSAGAGVVGAISVSGVGASSAPPQALIASGRATQRTAWISLLFIFPSCRCIARRRTLRRRQRNDTTGSSGGRGDAYARTPNDIGEVILHEIAGPRARTR